MKKEKEVPELVKAADTALEDLSQEILEARDERLKKI